MRKNITAYLLSLSLSLSLSMNLPTHTSIPGNPPVHPPASLPICTMANGCLKVHHAFNSYVTEVKSRVFNEIPVARFCSSSYAENRTKWLPNYDGTVYLWPMYLTIHSLIHPSTYLFTYELRNYLRTYLCIYRSHHLFVLLNLHCRIRLRWCIRRLDAALHAFTWGIIY
jgi:hypothetical protein